MPTTEFVRCPSQKTALKGRGFGRAAMTQEIFSLVTQRFHGIDLGRAPSWKVASQKCHQDKQQGDTRKRNRISRTQSKQERPQGASQDDGTGNANRHPNQGGYQSLPEYQSKDV